MNNKSGHKEIHTKQKAAALSKTDEQASTVQPIGAHSKENRHGGRLWLCTSPHNRSLGRTNGKGSFVAGKDGMRITPRFPPQATGWGTMYGQIHRQGPGKEKVFSRWLGFDMIFKLPGKRSLSPRGHQYTTRLTPDGVRPLMLN